MRCCGCCCGDNPRGQLLTPCFPRLNTKVRGSGFLLGSLPSSTCVLFLRCGHKLVVSPTSQAQALAPEVLLLPCITAPTLRVLPMVYGTAIRYVRGLQLLRMCLCRQGARQDGSAPSLELCIYMT
jgi:hypothetical protein